MKTLGVACTVAVLATVGVVNQSAARAAEDAVPAMIVLETLPVDPELANGSLVGVLGTVIVTVTPSADGKTAAAEGAGEFEAGMSGMPMDAAMLFGGE